MAWYHRLINVFRRETVGRDIEDELAFHLAERVDALKAGGMSDDEARREARRQFGPVENVREGTHDADILVWLESVMGDLRFALRSLTRRPAFMIGALVTLALGIGANAAIFSVVSGVVLGDLPFRDAGRLVSVYGSDDEGRIGVSELERARYREEPRAFADVGAWAMDWTNLTGDADAERVRTAFIDARVLGTLGRAPMMGRGFTETDMTPGSDGVAILSYPLWQRRFGADSAILGRTIVANANPVTIVGILPESFRLPADYGSGPTAALYRPLPIGEPDPRNFHYLSAVARLPDRTTVDAARAHLRGVAASLRQELSTLPTTFEVDIVPLRDDLFGSVRAALVVLQGSVALVLLIACLNVANLMLIRSERRMHEIAVRVALGATRRRIARQLVTESLLLGVGGGAVGLLLAVALVRVVRWLNPPGVPRLDEVGVDAGVVVFTAAIAMAASLLAGLAPVLRIGRGDAQGTLRQEGRAATGPGQRHRLQRALVTVEVAVGLMLAIGAGLLARSYEQMAGLDLGFDAERVVTMDLTLPFARYDDATSARAFYSELTERARALPDVERIGGTNRLPLASSLGDWGIRLEGREEERLPSGRRPWADWSVVTEGYVEALGLELVQGRTYTRADVPGSLPVVVVNETAARAYWPDGNALGARFKMSSDIDTIYRTVIGIVRDIRHEDLATSGRPQMYLPHAQFPATATFPVGSLALVLRTRGAPLAVAGGMRRLVRELDPDVPVSNVRTMDRVVSAAMSVGRFNALLFVAFGALGLILVAVGVYGVVGYSVAERTRELGIRAALGARPGDLTGMVVRQGVAVAGIGVAIGLMGALAGSRLLEGMLFGVPPRDPLVFAGVAVLLVSIAAAAAYVPARQATGASPLIALRE